MKKIKMQLIVLDDTSLILIKTDGTVISYGQSETGYLLVSLLDGTMYLNYIPEKVKGERRHLGRG